MRALHTLLLLLAGAVLAPTAGAQCILGDAGGTLNAIAEKTYPRCSNPNPLQTPPEECFCPWPWPAQDQWCFSDP
jgi:hypothetical protein